MPPTTVEPKVSLNQQQRDWLKQMGAILQVKLGGPAPPTKVDEAPSTPPPTVDEAGSKATTSPPTVPSAPAEKTPLSDKPSDTQESPPASPPKSAEVEAYEKELKVVKGLVDALNNHAHKAHITGELTSIGTELGKADTAFKAKRYADAMTALAQAKTTAGNAKGFADSYAAYAKKRADAQFLVRAWSDALKRRTSPTAAPTTLDNQITAVTDADNLAKPPTRNYTGATAKVEGVITTLAGKVTEWYVTPNKPEIDKLKADATKTKTFFAEQIKTVEAEFNALNSYIAAKDYRKALMQGIIVDRLVLGAKEASTRRAAFDTQRVKTVAAIDALKPFKALSTQMGDLNKRLAAADDQASVKNRQFENGAEALKKIEEDAKNVAKNGPAADAYAKDRQVADTAYQNLAKHKLAAAQKPLLDGIKTKLDKAAELAKQPAKVAAAGEELKLAKQDIDAATKVLSEADAVGTVADSATDAATGKKSLDALKVSIDRAKVHNRAADFTKDFKALDDKVVAAEKKLKDAKTVPAAIKDIKTIGDDLAKVMIGLTQQQGYAFDRVALETRVKNLKALPEAKTIQPSIIPVEKALKDAEAQDKAHAFDKRAQAMEKARAAADLAEKTAADTKAYDTRQKALETNVTGSALSVADKKQVTDAIKPAAAQAKTLNYIDATKLLVKAEATYESLLIGGFAKQTPPDKTKIQAAAKRMMDSGSAKEIDKLIQTLPDSTKHEVLVVLAKERFGIELKTDAGFETKSAKAMLNMMAKVPDDVRGNPSLKTVERRRDPDADPDKDSGGYYTREDKLVVIHGRPNKDFQQFGSNIARQLPRDVDPKCKPKNENQVDYFDFATLHEVGHSVDDNLQFMASREGNKEFANWRSYGGNVGPIVDAVAAHFKYDKTPEQKKALSDLIQGNEVTWPTPPAGTSADDVDKWNKAKLAVDNWYKLANVKNKVWWKQSDIDKIKIKVGADELVFTEAYARQWVSYDHAARKHGMTGYQFRAPGEWFAELYACYHSDKLQDGHPAVKWLKTLKV